MVAGTGWDGTNTPIGVSPGDWVMIHIVFDTSDDNLTPITQEIVVGAYNDRVVTTGGSPDRQSDLYIPVAFIQSGPSVQQKVFSDIVLLSDCLNFVAVKLGFLMN